MKRFLILSILTCSFLGSQAQDLRQLKIWALSLFEQNKDLTVKLEKKDSVINKLEEVVVRADSTIANHRADSAVYASDAKAYKEGIYNRNVLIGELKTEVKKRTQERNALGILSIILLILSVAIAL